ncbi:MAG: hypothetical protein M1818_006056 [Claussenomyces sp. TS43310]|nr:MAG: hypothetical protein M1818_006056 [Claussenomyces sp. TS43310]
MPNLIAKEALVQSTSDTEKSTSSDGSFPHAHLDKEFSPIQSPEQISRHSRSRSASRPSSARDLSRTVSQNGYGIEDDDSSTERDVEAAAAGTISEKDPFEVEWDGGDDDPMNPRSKSKFSKWIIAILCAVGSLVVTCTSSIYASTYEQIVPDLHTSQEVATLGLTLFVLGLAIGPMVLGPLSEFYGRRPIYVVAFAFFVIWIIPSAVARNIQTLVISRFFDGVAGSAFLTVSGGTVSDLFNRSELQAPMMLFTAAPFIGPTMGPLIGGFINQYAYWRWTYYVLLIWSGVIFALIIFFVPETYHPVLLKKKAQKIRQETGDDRWRAPIEKLEKSIIRAIGLSLQRPFKLLFFEQMVTSLCLLSAVLLGTLYLFFGAVPLVMQTNHDFSLSQSGLSFLGIAIGCLIGISLDPLFHKNYVRLVEKAAKAGTGPEPEYRLPPAILGAVLSPIGLFFFGWTSYARLPWVLPIIGTGFFGMGVLLSFSGIFTFLVDAYPMYAASALAANTFVRCIFAGAFPLFGDQMYKKLGFQWASSLLGFLMLAMVPFPFLFFKYGKGIRARSKMAKS